MSSIWDNLTHYWRLEESAGQVRPDLVGDSDLNERGGNINNTTGIKDNCARGAGVSTQWLSTFPKSPSGVSLAQPASLVLWFRPDSYPPGLTEFIFAFPSDPQNWYMYFQDTGVLTLGNPLDGDVLTDGFTLGGWNLVVVVIEGTTVKLSVNNAAFLTFGPITADPTEDEFNILGAGVDQFETDAKLDEIAIFNVALTQSQVDELWNGGAGLFPADSDFPGDDVLESEVHKRLQHPTVKIALLLELTAGRKFDNWIADSTYCKNGIMKVPCTDEIVECFWGTDELTKADNQLYAENHPGAWHWDGDYLWVSPPVDPATGAYRVPLGKWFWWRQPKTYSIFAATIIAKTRFYFSNIPKTLGNRFYDPRLVSAPDLSQRIEARLGGLGQIGGGTVTLENADGFFNDKQQYLWDAGEAVLKIGVDRIEEMAFEDYQVLARWGIQEWSASESKFTVRLIESKNKFRTKVPFTTFTREVYPNIEDSWVGRDIPILYGLCYGVEATPINVGTKSFKVAGHAVKDLYAVRVKRQIEQKNSRVVTAAEWQVYSGATYRWYLPTGEARNVLFNSTSLTKKDSVADCVANAGTWTTEENFVYVNPQGGQTISSGTYTLESAIFVDSWQQVNFATKNLAAGEFTLGDEWTLGTEVSVDVYGKVDSNGAYISNGVDIIRDMLSLVGQEDIDEDSFAEAKAEILKGNDEAGTEIFISPVGLAITKAEELAKHLEPILRGIGAYLTTNNEGQARIGVFMPLPSEGLDSIEFINAIEFEQETGKFEATAISVRYNFRTKEEWSELVEVQSAVLLAAHNQRQHLVTKEESAITDTDDVEAYAAQYLMREANPLKTFRITLPWIGFLHKPGDQLLVDMPELGVHVVAEVIEIKLDLGQKRCQLALGNQRGLSDQAGFWVDDEDKLPTRFSTLAGYGDGSLTWNDEWDPEIKEWARDNVGYWTDENGFASSTDPESKATSIWI